jgi:Uma2 family endonuclease
MTTVIAEPAAGTDVRLLTVADLAVLPDELPSGPVKYELEDGRLIIMAPPGDVHGAAQSNVTFQLKLLGELKGHGKARTEVAVIVGRNPDTVFVPDVAFIAARSLPIRTSVEGYHDAPPDIVVEVRSKNDSLKGLHRKGEKYLGAGVQIVWLLDPQSKTVTVLARDAAPVELREADTLTAGEIIPGFSVRVAELFVV